MKRTFAFLITIGILLVSFADCDTTVVVSEPKKRILSRKHLHPKIDQKFKKIVVIANKAAGKTTLVNHLRDFIANSEPVYEPLEENEYLQLYYEKLEENKKECTQKCCYNPYAFLGSKKFLELMDESELSLTNPEKCYIVDRSILEQKYIFMQNDLDHGAMSQQEFEIQTKQFDSYIANIPRPDIVIYLRNSTDVLFNRMKKRGRDFEVGIDHDYIRSLNDLYENSLIPKIKIDYKDAKQLIYDDDREEDICTAVLNDLVKLNNDETV